MTGRLLRKRKEPPASTLKNARKMPKRKAKRSETLGVCEINGTQKCDENKRVALVKFDGCNCKRLCMPCAEAWLNNSSTCPFCRAQVSLVNDIDVEYKRQREDHDVEQVCFRFPYRNWLGQMTMFQATVETSRLFANNRAAFKLPKEILFMVKVIESFDLEIIHDNGYYTFVQGKLFNFRGKRQQALYRILFYFAMHNRNPIAFFFLMNMLRKKIQTSSHNRVHRKLFDINDSSELEISRGIFHVVPDECLFQQSALQIYKRNTTTHHWHMLCHPLTILYPQHAMEIRLGSMDPPSEFEDSEEEDDHDFLQIFLEPTAATAATASLIEIESEEETTSTRI